MGFIRIMIAMLLAVSCQRSPSAPPVASSVVAMVDEEAITLTEFGKALEETRPDTGLVEADEAVRAYRRDLLDQLIDRRLFKAEATRLKLSVEAQELQEAIDQVQGDYSQEDFQQILKSQRVSFSEWKEKLQEDLLVRKLISQTVDSQISVTEKEITDYYKAHRNQFQQKERVRVRQIVVATQEEARQIRQLLISGQDFGEMAKARSLSPDKVQGGNLGFFAKGEMPEEFDVVFTLMAGKLSPIVKSSYGYHLFKVEERQTGKALTLTEATERIRTLLSEDKREGKFLEWVAGLRQKAKIRINYPLLDAPIPHSGREDDAFYE